jgi:hypothetical protein
MLIIQAVATVVSITSVVCVFFGYYMFKLLHCVVKLAMSLF